VKDLNAGVTVSILGKQFSVACPEDQRADLVAAAEYLDRKMSDIQRSGKAIGLERCAIMAALNISHELMELRRDAGSADGIEAKVRLLQERISTALGSQNELSL